MQLQARDKRALIGGAMVVTALLAILLWPRAPSNSDVELVPAAERGTPPPAAANPVPPPVAAAQPGAPAPPGAPVQPTPAPGGVPEGLKLTGVTATGAIFAYGDGSQRLVRRGREVSPGLVLQTVRVYDVILTANGSTLRLTFSGPATPMQPPANPAPAPATLPAQPSPPAQPTPPDRSLFR